MELIDEIFNRNASMELIETDISLLNDMIEMFDDFAPDVVSRLRAAVDEANAPEVREVSHEINGVVGNFYAQRAATTAHEIEERSCKGDLSDTPQLVIQLENDLDELQTALHEFHELQMAG